MTLFGTKCWEADPARRITVDFPVGGIQTRRRVSGIVQETLNVTVLAGGSVKLLLVNDDPLKKTLLHKGMQHPKHNEKVGLGVHRFMDFVRAAWTN